MQTGRTYWAIMSALVTILISSAAFAQYGYETRPSYREIEPEWNSPTVNPRMREDIERARRTVDTQNPMGGFEQGTPLDPELAEQTRQEQEKHSGYSMFKALVWTFGIGFALVILFIVVYAKRTMGDSTTVDSTAVSKTLAQLRKERSSPEELAEQFFEAVRFGSYPQYRALFATADDAQAFLSVDKLNGYLYGTLADRELQKLFRRLTDICSGAQVKMRSVRTSEPVNLTTHSGGTVRLVSTAAIAVNLPGGGMGKVPIGSMVEIGSRWKLFVPASPDAPTGNHQAVPGGPPQHPGVHSA